MVILEDLSRQKNIAYVALFVTQMPQRWKDGKHGTASESEINHIRENTYDKR